MVKTKEAMVVVTTDFSAIDEKLLDNRVVAPNIVGKPSLVVVVANNSSDREKATLGEWKVIQPHFKHLPVHAALLHNGKVLAFGGSGNDPSKLHKWDKPEIYEPDYTGKTDGQIYEISDKGIEGDMFCVGHTFLPDGKLFIAGGTFQYDGIFGRPFPLIPFSGLEHAYVFDPQDLSWTRLKNMRHGRWYPTCVMLPDGQVVTLGGLTKWPPWVFLPFQEIYSGDDDNKGWRYLEGGNKFFPLYPRIHLLPNGEIFYSGSYNTHLTFPFSLWGFRIATYSLTERRWKDLPYPRELHRQEGTSVLLPLNPPDYAARVILIGGGDTLANHVTNTVELIDFSEPAPQYRLTDSMKNERYYVYPVILPDQNILALGGKRGQSSHHDTSHHCVELKPGEIKHDEDAILETELFVTSERRWVTLAPMHVDRLYHSNAILLPDGTVMTMGSNPMRRCNELRVEIFRPPYLFRSDRHPVISKSPKEVTYDQTFEIEIGGSVDDIRSVAMMRPSSTTHCLNPEQRYIGLAFSKVNPNTLAATVPANRNVLPPGYYMLFILNEEDTPCIAPFLRVK